MRIILAILIMLCALQVQAIKQMPITKTIENTQKSAPLNSQEPTNYFSSSIENQSENTIGRKLSLKEKIGWVLFRHNAKRLPIDEMTAKTANNNAVLGFIFSLAGLLFFPLFVIPGLLFSSKALQTEKENPGTLNSNKKSLAKAGKILSYITLGLIAIGLIFIALYIMVLASIH